MRATLFSVFVVAAAVLGGGAHAASFDCAKASSALERLICDDPDLDSLDSQLAGTFEGALDRSLEPAAVRAGQRAWLRTRETCNGDAACLRAAYAKRIAALSAIFDPPPECRGETTSEINACGAAHSQRADREMARYLAAARGRLIAEAKEGAQSSQRALAGLDASQAAWVAHRKAECDAVYAWWSEGTIRGAMYESCWRDMTKARTAAILAAWLGFMDSTPPLMPPPSAK